MGQDSVVVRWMKVSNDEGGSGIPSATRTWGPSQGGHGAGVRMVESTGAGRKVETRLRQRMHMQQHAAMRQGMVGREAAAVTSRA